MDNVILIGFMGAGKTSIGIKLSYELRIPMEDTDKIIERLEQCKISDIFASRGEEAFRQMETNLLKKLIEDDRKRGDNKLGMVLSVGGGLPLREENRQLMKKLGKVIFLDAGPDTIYDRLKNDTTRPLLQCEDPYRRICDLMEARRQYYEDACTHRVVVDNKKYGDIVKEIVELCK